MPIDFAKELAQINFDQELQAPSPPPQAPQGKSVGGFLSNALTDTGNMLGGLIDTVSHPIRATQAALANKRETESGWEAERRELQRTGRLDEPMPIMERARGIAEAAYNEPAQAAALLVPGRAWSAVGRAGGAIPNAIGQGLYRGGVALMPRTLKQQFPNLAESGYREGIALTKRGAAKADRLTTASREQADSMISAAEGTRGRVSARRVVTDLQPVHAKLKRQSELGLPDDSGVVTQRRNAFVEQHQGGIPLTKAQALKREAQDMSEAAYRAQDRGAAVNSTDMLMNEAQATGLRREIENLIPEVAPVNRRTQELTGLVRAADQASQTGHVLSRMGGAGLGSALGGSIGGALPALATAAGGTLVSTPGGLTGLAVGMKPLVPMAAHSPQAIRAAILLQQLLGSQDQANAVPDR